MAALCFISHSTSAELIPDGGGIYVIPAQDNDTVELGSAYSRYAEQFLGFTPVKGWELTHHNTHAKTKSDTNSNESQLSSLMSGDVSVTQSSMFVSVEASASYASAMASNGLSKTIVVSTVVDTGTRKLNFDGIADASASNSTLSDLGVLGVAKSPTERVQEYGTGYVKQINYGASVTASLKFDFNSAQQQESFQAQVSVNDSTGTVNVGGDATGANAEGFDDVSISLTAFQVGGDPFQLAKILNESVVTCSWSNRSACIETVQSVYDYANDGFIAQVSTGDLSKSAALTYTIQEYAKAPNISVRSLATDSMDVLDAAFYFDMVNELTAAQKIEHNNRTTMEQMLSRSTDKYTTVEQELLDKMYKAAHTNVNRLNHYIKACRNNLLLSDDPGSCAAIAAPCLNLDAPGNSCLIDYDMSKLTAASDPKQAKLDEYYRRAKMADTNGLGQELFPGNSGFNMIAKGWLDNGTYGVLANANVINTASRKINSRELSLEATGTFSHSFIINVRGSETRPIISFTSSEGIITMADYKNGNWEKISDSTLEINGPTSDYVLVQMIQAKNPKITLGRTMQDVMVDLNASMTNAMAQQIIIMTPYKQFAFKAKPWVLISNNDASDMYAFDNTTAWTAVNVSETKNINGNIIGKCPSGGELIDGDNDYCREYGRLYTYDEAVKACAKYDSTYGGRLSLNWRLPSAEDYMHLKNIADNSSNGEPGNALKSKAFPADADEYKGQDLFGFRALAAGYVNSDEDTTLRDKGYGGYFWTSTEGANDTTATRMKLEHDKTRFYNYSNPKEKRYSVRCVADLSIN